MTETTPRQVLYALVAAGFLLVVAMLVIGAAVSGIAPAWWTAVTGAGLVVIAVWAGFNWRRTGRLLMASIGILLLWSLGTLLVIG